MRLNQIELLNKNNNRNMAELTGLQSILSKSHYKTQRKNKYSFGKSQRFSRNKSTYANDFFDVSSPRDTRTCSFGYGKKYFFVPPPNNPDVGSYNFHSEKKQGISFGISRQKLSAGDYLNKTIINKSPPCNNYDPKIETITKFANSSKYSIRKKTPSDSFIKQNYNPEPSKYQTNIEKEGKVTLSNFHTPKKAIFCKSARFIEDLQHKLVVGPGQYDAKEEANSKRKVSKKNIFSRAAKTTFTMEVMKRNKSQSPGPIYYVP